MSLMPLEAHCMGSWSPLPRQDPVIAGVPPQLTFLDKNLPKLVSILGATVTSTELCMVLEFMPRGNLYNLIHVEKLALDD